jgi:hypothetical protein
MGVPLNMPLAVYEGMKLTGKHFVVEETIFRNCTLVNCWLYYSGGAFEWENTNFQDCNWGFRGAARDTIQVLTSIGLLKPGQTPPPNLHVDKGKLN